ncbi:hypothetical protein LXL04_015633 [Taraxacum kok-saghyz]
MVVQTGVMMCEIEGTVYEIVEIEGTVFGTVVVDTDTVGTVFDTVVVDTAVWDTVVVDTDTVVVVASKLEMPAVVDIAQDRMLDERILNWMKENWRVIERNLYTNSFKWLRYIQRKRETRDSFQIPVTTFPNLDKMQSETRDQSLKSLKTSGVSRPLEFAAGELRRCFLPFHLKRQRVSQMAEIRFRKRRIMRSITVTVISVMTASMLASANRSGMKEDLSAVVPDVHGDIRFGYFVKLANYLFETNGSGYQHIWPLSWLTHMDFGFQVATFVEMMNVVVAGNVRRIKIGEKLRKNPDQLIKWANHSNTRFDKS